jgi:invasion protein IalB
MSGRSSKGINMPLSHPGTSSAWLLVTAAVALGAVSFAERGAEAQQGAQPKQERPMPKQPPASQRPVEAPQAVPPVAEPSAPVRTETITYDAWTVTCRDTADGKTKKVCSATLPMQIVQQNQRVNIGAWVIARNKENALISVIQTPQVDIGVLIAKGIEVKLGNGVPHKIAFVICNPQRCEATLAMDDATTKETIAAANGPAVVTFWKADGTDFSINLASIKGIDRALSAIR